jgi:sulfate transport system ATP-binding protein
LPVTIEKGRVFLDERPLEVTPDGAPDGPALLYVRPQDLEVVESGPGAIPGIVAAMRRHGGGRRIELAIGARRDRLEFEAPADFNRSLACRVTVKPKRWRIFPRDAGQAF